jgi:hypothetical protein
MELWFDLIVRTFTWFNSDKNRTGWLGISRDLGKAAGIFKIQNPPCTGEKEIGYIVCN